MNMLGLADTLGDALAVYMRVRSDRGKPCDKQRIRLCPPFVPLSSSCASLHDCAYKTALGAGLQAITRILLLAADYIRRQGRVKALSTLVKQLPAAFMSAAQPSNSKRMRRFEH